MTTSPPHAGRLCEERVSTTYIKEKTKVSMCFILCLFLVCFIVLFGLFRV